MVKQGSSVFLMTQNNLNIHDDIVDRLNEFVESNQVPHIMFYGPSGGGKRTIVNNFIQSIYKHDKQKIGEYVMNVDCARGKGIKFVREQVKFFAKINLELRHAPFKSVVLNNADKLTTDAQSALRRLIEIFSHNTRFFIVVEDKNSLLKPILSRLSEVYIPLPIINGKETNLHKYFKELALIDDSRKDISKILRSSIKKTLANGSNIKNIIELSDVLYQNGICAQDALEYLTKNKQGNEYLELLFDKIRGQYRNEKMILCVVLYLGLIRCDKDFHYMSFM